MSKGMSCLDRLGIEGETACQGIGITMPDGSFRYMFCNTCILKTNLALKMLMRWKFTVSQSLVLSLETRFRWLALNLQMYKSQYTLA